MAAVLIQALDKKESFIRDFRKAPPDVQRAAEDAIRALKQNPQPARLRVHSLTGTFDPKIFKADVFTNHSWQITFEMEGNTAILRRLARHSVADRDR